MSNPWLSMWCNPRATIRSIVAENPNRCLWLLALIYGISALLNGFQSYPMAVETGIVPMVLVALLLAPFWGYFFFSVWSWVIVFVGKLFKGRASFQEARAAYAWSCVPLLGNIPLWILLLLFYREALFYGPQDHLIYTGPALTLLFLILIGKLVFAIWSLVLYLQSLAEVQQYSVLRSIGNVIVASLFIGIVVAVLLFLFGAACSRGHGPTSALDWNNTRWIVQHINREEP